MENSDLFPNNSNSNITMMFLPGTHRVSSSIRITHIHNLTLQGPKGTQSNLTVTIECIKQAYFLFSDMHTLEINSLRISKCGAQIGKNARVIFAQNLQILLLKNLCFLRNLYGSAMCAIKTKKIIISNSLFDQNSASKSSGGAITIIEAGNLEITSSNFTNNNSSDYGGAIYLIYIHLICVTNSKFVNNSACKDNCKAPKGHGSGGGILIFGYTYPAKVTTVIFDGLILFENNFAQGGGGGLYAENVTLKLLGKTDFHNNIAHLSGGALVVIGGFNLSICTTSFRKNQAIMTGGAALIELINSLQKLWHFSA